MMQTVLSMVFYKSALESKLVDFQRHFLGLKFRGKKTKKGLGKSCKFCGQKEVLIWSLF